MAIKKSSPETLCPISRAESVVGDRWTVLVLRELFMRSHRFDEIQAQTGGTPQMVAARLKSLEADGLVERRAYSERPLRHEYHLTEKGAGLLLGDSCLACLGGNLVQIARGGPGGPIHPPDLRATRRARAALRTLRPAVAP